MFYEIYDWDHYTDEKEYHLINLSEIIQINRTNGTYSLRNDKTDKVINYYRITVYYTGKGNSWTFCYKSERERNIVYDDLKSALIKIKVLPEVPENPNDVSNILTEEFHPLEDILRNPPLLDVPEVKLCE